MNNCEYVFSYKFYLFFKCLFVQEKVEERRVERRNAEDKDRHERRDRHDRDDDDRHRRDSRFVNIRFLKL